MNATIDGLLTLVTPTSQQEILPIIRNEQFHSLPVHNNQPLLRIIWQFSQFIIKKQSVKISYQRQRGEYKKYTILPEAVIFSEYYFYIIAFNPEGKGNRFFVQTKFKITNLQTTKFLKVMLIVLKTVSCGNKFSTCSLANKLHFNLNSLALSKLLQTVFLTQSSKNGIRTVTLFSLKQKLMMQPLKCGYLAEEAQLRF